MNSGAVMDISFYLYALLSLLFYYVAGHTVFFICRIKATQNFYLNVFTKLFTGIVAFITVYAIAVTHGRTVNLGFIIIGCFAFYFIRKQTGAITTGYSLTEYLKIDFKKAGLAVIEMAIITLVWNIFREHAYKCTNYNFPNLDNLFASRVAEYINITGYESAFNVYTQFGQYLGTAPYHYFEIWLTAGSAWAFNTFAYDSFIKIVTPVLLTVISVGMIAIVKIFIKTNAFNLVAPLLMFLHGTSLPVLPLDDILTTLYPVSNYRSLTIYPVIICFILLFSKSRPLALVILSSIAIVTISGAIGTIGGVGLACCILFFFKKPPERKEYLTVILCLFLLSVFLAGFYFITGEKEQGVVTMPQLFHGFRTTINIYGKTLLEGMYIYAVYIVIFGYLFFKVQKPANWKFLGVVGASVCFVSISVWAFLYQMIDSVQLFANTAIPVIQVFAAYMLVSYLPVLINKKIYIYIICIIVLPMFCYSAVANYKIWNKYAADKIYDQSYVESIRPEVLQPGINPMGVYFKAKEEYKGFFKNSLCYTLGDYLEFMKPGFSTIALSVFDIPLDSTDALTRKREELMVSSAIFYRFVDAQKQAHEFVSVAQSQVAFIRKFKINYGIISKNANIPPEVTALISKTITDPLSGERFVLFAY